MVYNSLTLYIKKKDNVRKIKNSKVFSQLTLYFERKNKKFKSNREELLGIR